jgi:hypothetical protein
MHSYPQGTLVTKIMEKQDKQLSLVLKWMAQEVYHNGAWVFVAPAKEWYGPHATGWVLVVNGTVHLQGELGDLKKSVYYPPKG